MMHSSLICSSGLISIFCFIPIRAIAQVTPDNTLSTTVDSTDGQNFTIENGDRTGNNLFHSFQEFSVPNNGSATFNNEAGITNIFSRVTGGNISEIQGAINANGGADLLLINPAGIVFGENASLNIGGSFLATTADSLLFKGGEFSAIDPQTAPMLTINRPIGLRFGNSPGSIINRAGTLTDPAVPPLGLQVQPGQNITLVGGEIQLDGGFTTASGGKIELSSVAEAAEVGLDFNDLGYELDYQAIENFGDIFLSGLSGVNVGGIGGGAVRLQGKNIVLTGGAKVSSNTFGSLPGKDITISASDSVQVLGATDVEDLFESSEASLGFLVPLRSEITSNTFNTGDAGDIKIDAQRLLIEKGGHVTASTVSRFEVLSDLPGEGGNIEINADKTVEVRDVAEVKVVGEEAEQNLFVQNRESIESFGVSSIVTVTVNAANAGNLTINTGKLTIADGGAIGTSSLADGASGSLSIDAAESVDVSNRSPIGITPSSINSSAVTTGTSGDIRINTPQLNVQNGGEINVQTSSIGQAGNIEIEAGNLLLNDGTLTAATLAGDRGNINIIDADTIFLRNNSNITTNATELSTGGDINLNSRAIAIDNSSSITAIAEAGQGGNIQINSQALFREPNAQISAASNLGIDGTITFNTPDVDPAAGIVELPAVPIDAEAVLAQDLCKVEDENISGGSSFVVTGKGGLTPTSAESLSNINRVVNWADETAAVTQGALSVTNPKQTKKRTIIQSQGLAIAPDGSMWLTANAQNSSPHNSNNHPDCQA